MVTLLAWSDIQNVVCSIEDGRLARTNNQIRTD